MCREIYIHIYISKVIPLFWALFFLTYISDAKLSVILLGYFINYL